MLRRPWARWATNAVLWAPVAFAIVFVLQHVRTLGTVRDSLASHADFASVPVLAELMSHRAPGAVVTLGDYRWYEALWLLRATKFLPSHQTVWEFVPFVLWAIAVACVAVAVRRVSTRWAAWTAAALLICGGLTMRATLWSLNTHGPAAVHATILGLAAVLLVQARGRERFAWWALVSALILIPVTALGATDPLLPVVGIAPFLVACLVLAWRTSDWIAAAYGVVVAGGSAIGGLVIVHIADGQHYSWTHRAVTWVGADKFASQLGLLPGALSSLISRPVWGDAVNKTSALAMGAALLGLVALVVVVRAAIRVVWPQLRAGLGPARPAAEARREIAREVLLAFWVSALVLTCAIYVLTSAAFDVWSGRYVVTAWVAVCVLLPVVAEIGGQRLLGAAVASVIAGVATLIVIANPKPTRDTPYPSHDTVASIAQWAKAQGATSGYAGFWDAIPLTWQSRFGLLVYPVTPCADPAHSCPMYEHQISSWYGPGDRGRRLFVVDSRMPGQPAVDPAFGKPVAERAFGSITVYVYPKDITPQLG